MVGGCVGRGDQRIENWAKKRDEATSAARKLEDLGKQMETKLMLLEERDRSLKEKLASLGKVRP
jgi:hypothetical protein